MSGRLPGPPAIRREPLTWARWLIGGMLAAWAAPPLVADTVNRIVAIVNDEVITDADVETHLSSWLEQGESRPDHPDAGQLRQMVLQRLIEQRVILQEARREGLAVGPEEIARQVDRIRDRFESDEAFRRSLADAQLSPEQLKEDLRRQALAERLIDAKVRSTITVSPQEVASAIGAHPELAKPGDRVRASHLLVRVSETRSAEQARAVVEELHRRLMAGEGFADLARRHSEDPHAAEGGDMGWVAQGELLAELDAALFNLPVGEVSPLIQTRVGFHLVKVEERRAASSLSVTEANQAVYQRLFQQKFQAAFRRWLTGLLRRAYIEIVAPQGSAG